LPSGAREAAKLLPLDRTRSGRFVSVLRAGAEKLTSVAWLRGVSIDGACEMVRVAQATSALSSSRAPPQGEVTEAWVIASLTYLMAEAM